MSASVYTVWQQFARLVKQVVPNLHGHRCKTLGWLVVGIMLAKSVASAQMAEVLGRIGGTKASSQERTISRFLANEGIDAQGLWQSFLPVLLAGWAKQPEVTFVVDTTLLGNWAILVSFGILHHSRVWPLGWRVMPGAQSWEQGQYELIAHFVAAVSRHLGQVQCRLLADSGISREQLVHLCEEAGWHYLLRIELDKGYYAGETDAQGQPLWQPLNGILSEPGQYWQGRVWLWKTHQRQTWLTAIWQVGQETPLVVISDEGAGRHYLCRYRGRMRVEATFQDKKSRGFGLQVTHVRDRVHLDRLLLLLCLAIWWLARLGAACIHHGQRRRFDRADRRDKSVLRLGRQWFLDILERAPSPASLARCLPFQRHGHGWRLCLRF
jgi:hypothetical protein